MKAYIYNAIRAAAQRAVKNHFAAYRVIDRDAVSRDTRARTAVSTAIGVRPSELDDIDAFEMYAGFADAAGRDPVSMGDINVLIPDKRLAASLFRCFSRYYGYLKELNAGEFIDTVAMSYKDSWTDDMEASYIEDLML